MRLTECSGWWASNRLLGIISRSEPYALGDGYGHLAVSVDDLDAEHQRLVGLGFNPGAVVDFNHDGKKLAPFFFISDPDGYKIEMLQRGGRYL